MKFEFKFLSSFSAVFVQFLRKPFAQSLTMLNHFLDELKSPSIQAKLVSINLSLLDSFA